MAGACAWAKRRAEDLGQGLFGAAIVTEGAWVLLEVWVWFVKSRTDLDRTCWERRSTPQETVASGAAAKHPGSMLRLIAILFHAVRALFRSRSELAVENLALRQQFAVLKTKRSRPPLSIMVRAFWIALRRVWPK